MRNGKPDFREPIREILIVDDDLAVQTVVEVHLYRERVAVTRLVDKAASVAFVATRSPALVLLDLTIAHQAGLDLLRSLKALQAPVIATSAQSNVRVAVDAMKYGAIDFFEKPLDMIRLLPRLREILAVAQPPPAVPPYEMRPAAAAFARRHLGRSADLRDMLTPREQDVLVRVAGGASNKEIGRVLGISPRTVEVHRARIMEKLGARNAVDLVRIVMDESEREVRSDAGARRGGLTG